MDPITDGALRAGYHRAQDPTLTQREIGERANLGGQAQVSRLLTVARERGYLREVFEFPPDLAEDDRQRVKDSFFRRHSELEGRLKERARELNAARSDGGSPFKRLHVVAAPGLDDGDERSRERAFQSFGANAAEIVADYIDGASTCSVAWGRTISTTVRHVRSRPATPGQAVDKLFMPIAGEPTNFEPNGVSPSDAAQTLAAAWPESESLSLRGVQARIPKTVHEMDEGKIARELISYSRNYRRIFGPLTGSERPLIAQVAMILTGIGDAETSGRAGEDPDRADPDRADPWYRETIEAESPEVLDLAVGNLGGVWLTRSDAPEEYKLKVEQVNERWLGAKHDDFKRCSLNADMPTRPGVVVVAVEPEKAEIVLEALYLINVLIVSRQLADALAEAPQLMR
jgi:DNA-binding transcriptional regulator LsrR (DeoR family)